MRPVTFLLVLLLIPLSVRATDVVLSADAVRNNAETNTVEAIGNVQIISEDQILVADRVVFNRSTDKVRAMGNVAVTTEDGNVLFGDTVNITRDMKDGVVREIRALIGPDGRVAGRTARRRDGRYTELEKAVYSPCKPCAEGEKPLSYQIKAEKVIHDNEDLNVSYRHARLELFDIPVAYTPYLSHADPRVKRRSGFLMPLVGWNDTLGFIGRSYYYLDVAPHMDATIETTFTGQQGPLLGGEWRQRFTHGSLVLNGSITRADREEESNNQTVFEDSELRSHLFAEGRYDFTNHWRGGMDVAISSDESYLREYDYSEEDIFTSRAFIEGFWDRNYAEITTFTVQDFRPGERPDQPIILPLITYQTLGDAGSLWGGRGLFNTSLLGLQRNDGQDVTRFSADLEWKRRLYSDLGVVTTLDARLLNDLYWVSNGTEPDPGGDNSYVASRFFPQLHITSGLPLIRPVGSNSLTVEPIMALTLSPNVIGDDTDIPNEDSADVELDAANLLRANRFPGRDRLEDGIHSSYGLRLGLFNAEGGYSRLFLGQSYRFTESSDLFPEGSGLESRQSDFVGRLELSPSPFLLVDYRFRLDEETLESRQHEAAFHAGPSNFRVFGEYLFLEEVSGTGIPDNRQELTFNVLSRWSDHWSTQLRTRSNLGSDADLIEAGMLLTWQDDCLLLQLDAKQDFTERLSGGINETSIFFRIGLKHIGEFNSPDFGGS